MADPRFFYPYPLVANTTVDLPSELAHHAIRVLRLKPSTPIVLFDGRGGEYPARLIIDGKKGRAALGDHAPVDIELAGEIILAQGIAASDKMDWIIEKATELGVARVVPVAAQRSVLQLSGERLVKRMQHWRRIAQAASEQCGRNRIMAIDDPCSLRAFIGGDTDAHGLALLCHPNADSNLADALSPAATRITILVGPEGGWSPEELAIAERSGAQRIQFGTRVLRTETAGLALVSAISALQGWN